MMTQRTDKKIPVRKTRRFSYRHHCLGFHGTPNTHLRVRRCWYRIIITAIRLRITNYRHKIDNWRITISLKVLSACLYNRRIARSNRIGGGKSRRGNDRNGNRHRIRLGARCEPSGTANGTMLQIRNSIRIGCRNGSHWHFGIRSRNGSPHRYTRVRRAERQRMPGGKGGKPGAENLWSRTGGVRKRQRCQSRGTVRASTGGHGSHGLFFLSEIQMAQNEDKRKTCNENQ